MLVRSCGIAVCGESFRGLLPSSNQDCDIMYGNITGLHEIVEGLKQLVLRARTED